MTKAIVIASITITAAFAATAARAADPAAGKAKYEATCVACHGANGISVAPIYPNVAGQKYEYLVSQMQGFRDGTRQNPIMAPMAQGLSDIDIAHIAAYLSALKQ
ncbi:MAG: cytochrome C-555 [Polyangiaceae bacterium UTPRO1]|jgi:cytochrome c553|nr:cytochrome c [Myxococcales bacterium]OQY69319.1 MAG: cytochrome C-555 [Polyangiaceae bacterium UTPRO1]